MIFLFLNFRNKGFKSNGYVRIGANSISYRYNPLIDNDNALTLRSLSTNAKKEYTTNGKYHAEFQKFVDYYGVPDYGSKFVTAALDGSKITFSTPGIFDFTPNNATLEERSAAAITGMIAMIVPMQVLGELENALDTCSSCLTAECDSMNSLYKAVAYYTGSMEMTSLFQKGSPLKAVFAAFRTVASLYIIANIFCNHFGTCEYRDISYPGTSNANFDIFTALSAMKIGLVNNCTEARVQKEIVAKKMLIPLIQYMLVFLRFSLNPTTDTDEFAHKYVFGGFVVATSVLPLVHFCNSTSAKIILQTLVGQDFTQIFSIVKTATEETYECLGITAADIGTLKLF
jgi:hypothetical protein